LYSSQTLHLIHASCEIGFNTQLISTNKLASRRGIIMLKHQELLYDRTNIMVKKFLNKVPEIVRILKKPCPIVQTGCPFAS